VCSLDLPTYSMPPRRYGNLQVVGGEKLSGRSPATWSRLWNMQVKDSTNEVRVLLLKRPSTREVQELPCQRRAGLSPPDIAPFSLPAGASLHAARWMHQPRHQGPRFATSQGSERRREAKVHVPTGISSASSRSAKPVC
jgi:hypothetical protein